MKAIRVLSVALALGLTSQQMSCSKDSSKKEQSADDPRIDALYGDIRTIEKDFSQGFLLRSAQDNEKALFADVVRDIKIAIMRLRKDPTNGPALSALFIAQQDLMSLNILSQDASQLDGFKSKLSDTIDYIAGLQGKTLDQVERVLFSTKFSESLEPFSTLTAGTNKVGWIKSNHEEVNFAFAKTGKADTELHTWLFSPTFDLTNVRNPRFNIKQSINRYGKPISDSVFVLVSDNYTGGEVTDATWEYVQFARVPDGSNFAVIQSEDYDLSRYAGKKITIAFQYRFKSAEGYKNDGPTWQLNSLNLMGNGPFEFSKLDLSKATLKDVATGGTTGLVGAPKVADVCRSIGAQPLFDFQFNKASVGTNFTTKQVPSTIFFAPMNYTNVVRFSGYGKDDGNKVGVSWLISKEIDVSHAKNLCLSVAESAYFPDKTIDLTKTQILVSTDYAGDPETATWVSPLKNRNAIAATVSAATLNPLAAGSIVSGLIPADAKKIYVAFRYEATATSAPWWGVSDLNLTAIPDGTGALKLNQADAVATNSAPGLTGPTTTPSGNAPAGNSTTGNATPKPSPAIQPFVAAKCKDLTGASDLFSHQFSTPIEGLFTVVDGPKNVNINAIDSYPGALRFSGFDKENPRLGKSMLISKTFDVSQVADGCLSLADVVYFAKSEINLAFAKVKVSTDYTGDVTKATWTDLTLEGRTGVAGTPKKAPDFAVVANAVMLTDILKTSPKSLTVALEYESVAGNQPWWGVTDLTIRVVNKAPVPAANPVVPAPSEPTGNPSAPAAGGEDNEDAPDPIVVNPS
jgi:hypothetical protein